MFLSRPFGNIVIGIGISIAKNLFLPSDFFFLNRSIFLFFLVLSYDISTILLQILVSLRFLFIHPEAFIGVLEKGYLNFPKALLGFFQKPLQSSYSVENLLASASVKRNSTAHVISGIFKNLKNMQGQAGGCNLKTRNLLKTPLKSL